MATEFFHIGFIPLFPTATYWILEEEGRTFRGIPLPLSLKSVLLAYGRAAVVLLGFAVAIGLPDFIRSDPHLFDLFPDAWREVCLQSLRVVGTLFCGGLYLFFFRLSQISSSQFETLVLFLSAKVDAQAAPEKPIFVVNDANKTTPSSPQ